jgi:glycosyltransferase involved in cell wall biosynthesis
MRVICAHVQQHLERSGGDESFDAEVGLLRSAGHEVRELRLSNADLHEIALVGIWNRHAYRTMREVALEHRAQVAWLHNIDWYGPALAFGASDAGAAVVMALRDERRLVNWWDVLRGKRWDGTLAATTVLANTNVFHVKQLWRHVDLFVANSRHLQERHVRAGWPEHLIAVKPEAVHPEPRHGPAKTRLRQLLYAGRLDEEGGVRVLLGAWRLLGIVAPELKIIGAGALGQRRYPFGPRMFKVRWLGELPHDRVLELMGESMAVIVPGASSGRTVLEAHAAGCLSIAADLGGLREAKPAILVPPGDAEALATAVRTVLQRTFGERLVLHAEARKVHEQFFSTEHQLAALEGCMKLALDERARKTARKRLAGWHRPGPPPAHAARTSDG